MIDREVTAMSIASKQSQTTRAQIRGQTKANARPLLRASSTGPGIMPDNCLSRKALMEIRNEIDRMVARFKV